MCWALQHHVLGVKCENMRNRPKQLFNTSPPLEYFFEIKQHWQVNLLFKFFTGLA